MGIYILKRKTFTKYDDTDNLKRMKDSDILAEKLKQPETTGHHVAAGALTAGLGGAAIGAVAKAATRKYKGLGFKGGAQYMGKSLLKGGKTGLIIGAGIGAAAALSRRSKEKADNEWYNRRLQYAQRQAMRREKADWKSNMTQRDGYSY